jgi:hypothetical protein
MGVRTRGFKNKAGAAKLKADRAARAEAELVVDRWNRRLATGRDMPWSPATIHVHARKCLLRYSFCGLDNGPRAGAAWVTVVDHKGCRWHRSAFREDVMRHSKRRGRGPSPDPVA